MTQFSQERIDQCLDAMTKPACLSALRDIASGLMRVEVLDNGNLALESINGLIVRDPERPDQRMGVGGGWALYPAGMIDAYGVVTQAGREWLAKMNL